MIGKTSEIKKMWEIIKAIEDAGVQVDRAYWKEDAHLQVDVNPADQERAGVAVEAMWQQKQTDHMEHIGLIAVPIEEGESR